MHLAGTISYTTTKNEEKKKKKDKVYPVSSFNRVTRDLVSLFFAKRQSIASSND